VRKPFRVEEILDKLAEQLLELIAEIPPDQAPLAQVLRERVRDFNFESIVQVIRP
jgi:hypothetical protein